VSQDIDFWTVPKEWKNQTAVIFASGPSLNQSQIDYVKAAGVRTIAINRTLAAVPWADVHYFADYKFWRWIDREQEFPDYADIRAAYRAFTGHRITIADAKTDALHLRRGHQRGLSLNPEELCTGNNSGYQAINLAFLFGAQRIILLGYDQAAMNGRTHHHRQHPSATNPDVYDAMLECWPFIADAIKGKAEVINCTPGSRIESFPKVALNEAL